MFYGLKPAHQKRRVLYASALISMSYTAEPSPVYFNPPTSKSSKFKMIFSPSLTTMQGNPMLPFSFTGSNSDLLSLNFKNIFMKNRFSVISISTKSILFLESNSFTGGQSGHNLLVKKNIFFIISTHPFAIVQNLFQQLPNNFPRYYHAGNGRNERHAARSLPF